MNHYEVGTYWEHVVAEYARISLFEVEELNWLDYLRLRRDAFIYSMNQTEKGREYLDNAWMMEQTEPDRNALRNAFGKRGG